MPRFLLTFSRWRQTVDFNHRPATSSTAPTSGAKTQLLPEVATEHMPCWGAFSLRAPLHPCESNTKFHAFRGFPVTRGSRFPFRWPGERNFGQAPAAGSLYFSGSSAAARRPGSHWKRKMATAAAASASEAEPEPKAGPTAEGEEDGVKTARTRRKVLPRAVAAAAYKAVGPGWDQQEEGVSESDGDEEYAMASSAESSPGEYEWEYDEEEEKNQLEIERLEEQLSINVYDYNCHVDLIRLLRLEGELTKVRMARQKMSEIFPLTEELWLEWLHDEISMALDGLDREHVYELFEKAVKDYICPNIWLEYGQYSVGGIGQKGGLEKVRSVFERALSSVGLHMTKGLAIWEAYREFESAIVEAARPIAGFLSPFDREQTFDSQLEKVHNLFRRQLAIPLYDMEATFAEYEEWSEDPIPESVIQNYNKALQQLERYKPYEEALLQAEAPRLAEYQAYIDFEMKIGDPARVQLIFERALVENCLVPDLWIRYSQYLDRQLKVKDLVLSVHNRAVRNCPWTVALWTRYLLAMERHGVDHRVISVTFEKALSAGFIQATDYVEIWQAYLDYLRRRVDFKQDSSKELEELRSAFTRALEYLKQEVEERFNESGDPSCMIMQNWARIEARLCNNMQKARELWDSIMTKGNAKYANMWLEYYNLERAHGDTQHCRKALHRAVQCTSDYPEHVCEVLLTMERTEGTLEDWDIAVQKTETRLARVNEQRIKAAEKEAALAQQEEEKAEQRKRARAEKKALKKKKKTRGADKRKAEEDDEKEWGDDEEEQPSKRRKVENSTPPAGEAQDLEAEMGLFGKSAPVDVDPPSKQKERAAALKRDMPKVPHDSSKDSITVFVSNLPYSMDEPEVKLRPLFEACGEVTEIRPIFSNRGDFRGYCYVEFKEEKSALQALELDRKTVEGRPMFVSPCVDKSKHPDFKVFRYSTALEKHKLFVSGLPFSCTKEELEEICKAHGTVKDIRLVTNRAGKPKGLAYVEYENESQASQAVLKMDGMTIKENVIKVAISNPPQRKVPEKPETKKAPGGGMVPRQIYGARGKGRTQLCLLPRALQRPSTTAAQAENGPAPQPAVTTSAATEAPKMSNADFAKLLLRK
ncbi:spliceosome associated factor 3, U4/U6 recycling protein isoform X1 [Canis aureus]|uniref:squamous cell carcinoma antigen recognized by T-cells 3 isoform X1 n=1 Tax=Canis lupus familiaris TaxID=9615 RepID=UPI00004A6B50|nr:squamous cell carcinoma antigen recognized by T-cells 3 isoform X1 [Canis lupus familiaris]|eukprot:XP_005636398.1 squamous cell carcinoma antigen recognized by T-cells 3 isoform X1 [Canis lupus familiaris]